MDRFTNPHRGIASGCGLHRPAGQGGPSVYVAGSTECFPDQPLNVALQRLADLELTRVEISVRDAGPHLRPADVLTDLDAELAALEQRREKTRALKQAMMQELLTGRTRLV